MDTHDLALDQYGLLLCIRSWLKGELPEANTQQFIEMVDAIEPPQQQAEITALKAALQSIRDEAIEAAFNSENNPAFGPDDATLALDAIAALARRALESDGT
jgi:hypothetical protein